MTTATTTAPDLLTETDLLVFLLEYTDDPLDCLSLEAEAAEICQALFSNANGRNKQKPHLCGRER